MKNYRFGLLALALLFGTAAQAKTKPKHHHPLVHLAPSVDQGLIDFSVEPFLIWGAILRYCGIPSWAWEPGIF